MQTCLDHLIARFTAAVLRRPASRLLSMGRAAWLAGATAVFAAAAVAAPVLPIDRTVHDAAGTRVDLRSGAEFAIVPTGEVDPDTIWWAPASAFRPMTPGQRLRIPEGSMLLARIELHVQQLRDPDYLQFPSARLDRVRLWARAEGQAWQSGEGGDRVALSRWRFVGPFPAFELPDGNERLQLVIALEHRGTLNVPFEWTPDQVFRADRLTHSFTFGIIAGLGAALALVCALAAALFRRLEFAALAGYAVLTSLTLLASNGYAAVYLWPQWPLWNDPAKVFLGTLLVSWLLPLMAWVLQLNVHRPVWWKGTWRWAVVGMAYAALQVLLLPPEWRTVANTIYVAATLLLAGVIALHGVLRGDTMSRLALGAVALFAISTLLAYAEQFGIVNELGLNVASGLGRLGFVVLMLCVAVQRHRFGRDVLSRQMVSGGRDALTGLLNRTGLQQELVRATLLADGAAALETGVIICDLRSIGTVRAEFGDEVCDRVLVRVAFVLQNSVQGNEAMLARLGYGRFAVVVMRKAGDEGLQALATRILSRMLAQTDLPDAVRDMKLRISMTRLPLADVKLEQVEEQVNREFAQSTDPRNIRWLAAA